MYLYPQPPYLLVAVGLLIGILCGTAFEATLKEQVQQWSQGAGDRPLAEAVRQSPLVVPFGGILIGICLFLSSGIQIFAFSARSSWLVGTVITILTGWWIWSQLGKVLREIEKGEFKLMELEDTFQRPSQELQRSSQESSQESPQELPQEPPQKN